MSVTVNPPPQVKIPSKFFEDPETRWFFEQQKTILFQLWQRTGGNLDLVAGQQIVIVASSDIVLDSFGSLIVVDAGDSAVQVALPNITLNDVGESVTVEIIDATYDATIVTTGGQTIVGDTSVIMNQQYMSIKYTAITLTAWVIT